MPFTQIMTVEGAEVGALERHVERWHQDQAGVAPGYLGSRVLADDHGRVLIEVDFTSEEEARRNNQRSETAEWAEGLRRLAAGEPEYQNLEEIFTTYSD